MADQTRKGEVALSRDRVPVMCRMNLYAGIHGEEHTEGYEFQIDGLDFIVHRAIRTPHLWSVTEPRTGLAVIQDWGSRKKAIWRAEQVIAEQGGAAAVDKAMVAMARKHGFEVSEVAA